MYNIKPSRKIFHLIFVLIMAFSLIFIALFLIKNPASAKQQGNIITVDTYLDDMVSNNGTCSLREAIESANNDSAWDACTPGDGWDSIVLPAGVYSLTRVGANEDANINGDLDIDDNVNIIGSLVGNSVVDANIIDRAFHIISGQVYLINLTIRNGLTPDDVSGGDGGGIKNVGGALTVSHSKVIGNLTGDHSGDSGYGGDGGGIYNAPYAILHVNNSLVSVNATGTGWNGGNGGGIYCAGYCTVSHSIIGNNTAGEGTGGYGGHGGGIYSDGDYDGELTIEYSTIVNNEAGDSTLDGSYGGWGGGLFCTSVLSISYSTVNDNHAGDSESESSIGCGGYGGGIYTNNVAEINNSTISGNRAGNALDLIGSDCGGNGGGIKNVDIMTLTNSTIAYNQVYAGDGGGIEAFDTAPVYMHNTILANNIDFYGQAPDCNGQVISEGYNLVEDYVNGCLVLVQPGGDILGQDPLLQALKYNGGNTATHALLWTSPAIDKGQCRATTDDQRNVPRPVDFSSISNADDGCDIGAYERISAIYLPIILQ